ncbi:hypothetical protein AHAS_Ahas04G0147900 [Arachis hypogaea]
MLREKRSKRRNDGSQTANIAPDRFDSTEERNDFSETQWEDDVPSFSLGISLPVSQPTPLSQVTVTQPSQPSQPTVSMLEVLADAVVDAGVTAALKFVEARSAKLSFTTAEVYKTPEKEKETTEELKEKCYHLITHWCTKL